MERKNAKERKQEYQNFILGYRLHWPDLDEDLSVTGIIEGRYGYYLNNTQIEKIEKALHNLGAELISISL